MDQILNCRLVKKYRKKYQLDYRYLYINIDRPIQITII